MCILPRSYAHIQSLTELLHETSGLACVSTCCTCVCFFNLCIIHLLIQPTAYSSLILSPLKEKWLFEKKKAKQI